MKLTLLKKSLLGMGLIFTFTGLLAFVSYNTISKLNSGYSQMLSTHTENIKHLGSLKNKILTLRTLEKEFILTGDNSYRESHAKVYKSLDETIKNLENNLPSDLQDNLTSVKKGVSSYREDFKNLTELKTREGDSKTGLRGNLRSTAHNLETFIKDHGLSANFTVGLLTFRRREKDYLLRRDPKYLAKLDQDINEFKKMTINRRLTPNLRPPLFDIVSNYREQFSSLIENTNAINQRIENINQTIKKIEKEGLSLIDESNQMIQREKLEMESETEHAYTIFYTTLALVFFFLVTACYFLFKVTKTISSQVTALRGTVSEFKRSSSLIEGASGTLQEVTIRQSSAIQETAASVDEITAMVSRNTQSAISSKEKSVENSQAAIHGKETVDKVIGAMNTLSDGVNTMTSNFGEVSKELENVVTIINQIGDKAQVINDIVFQTKLLSFNASVEAARAGEHGKGFAVVAEEVGNLASMSGQSANEITSLLSSSIQKVTDLVKNNNQKFEAVVSENKKNVTNGIEVAKECETALNQIIANIENINESVTEIATASQEQDAGVKEVSKAINEFNHANQETVGLVQDSRQYASQILQNAHSVAILSENLEALIQGDLKKLEDTHLAEEMDLELTPTAQSPTRDGSVGEHEFSEDHDFNDDADQVA